MSVYWTTPVWMWPLLLVVAAGAVLWTRRSYQQTHPAANPSLLRILISLRTAALLLLVLAVAGPVLSLVRTQNKPAELLVLMEDSGSMALAHGASESPSRWEFALEMVAVIEAAFGEAKAPVRVHLVRGNGLLPAEDFRLDDAVIPAPAAHGTDLGQLLSREILGRENKSTAILLISDGQQTVVTGGEGEMPGTQRTPGSELFVLGVGDPTGSADRLLTDLRYPDTAYAGDSVLIQLVVADRFAEGTVREDLVVRLMGSGGLVAKKVLSATTSVMALELEFIPTEVGLQVYELEVSPLDNERFRANNKVSLAIDVQKSRAKVLLLSEFPGWDVRFLAQAAAKEQRVDLQVVYASADGLVFADSLKQWQEPTSSEAWLAWDAVILTSWSGKLGHLAWGALSEAVEKGMGLWLLPGAGLKVPQGRLLTAPPPVLLDVLPVVSSSWSWQRGAYFLAEEGLLRGHSVFAGVARAYPGKATVGGFLLGDLPPLSTVVASEAREGALTLVWGVKKDSEQGRVPVLVVDRQAAGPVVWLGGRRLWETAFWNQGVAGQANGDPDFQPMVRLLRNLLVWVSSGAQETGLAFTGHRSIFQAGERIKLAAQWRNLRGQPLINKSMQLVLERNQGGTVEVQSFSFGAMDPVTGAAEVQLPALPPGRYVAQLQGSGDPPVKGPVAELTVLDHSVEETQVRLDNRGLAQFASRFGGRYYDQPGDPVTAKLVADLLALTWQETETVKRQRLDFWSGWPYLLLVSLLLGAEWFLRRRHGML